MVVGTRRALLLNTTRERGSTFIAQFRRDSNPQRPRMGTSIRAGVSTVPPQNHRTLRASGRLPYGRGNPHTESFIIYVARRTLLAMAGLGFEPRNPRELIYSQPRLSTSLPCRDTYLDAGTEPLGATLPTVTAVAG